VATTILCLFATGQLGALVSLAEGFVPLQRALMARELPRWEILLGAFAAGAGVPLLVLLVTLRFRSPSDRALRNVRVSLSDSRSPAGRSPTALLHARRSAGVLQ
jgi:hypothetical protein